MKTMGIFATGVMALAMLGGTLMVIRMLPELKRYLTIRNM
jgi:hypothetical protein